MKWAGEDILYLEKIDKVNGKTRISGRLINNNGRNIDIGGRKIRISGYNKVWEVFTDINGVYEIYYLPPGEYDIEPEIPHGWRIDPYSTKLSSSVVPYKYTNISSKNRIEKISIVLKKGAHASLDIDFIPDTAIRGKLLAPSGQPIEGGRLDVQLIDDAKRLLRYDITDKNGEFDIDEISEGRYILVANVFGNITNEMPFRTTYYPGVFDMKKADVFSITPGTFFNDIEFRIPEYEKSIQISAIAL